jgi:hypothetical protein
MLHAELARSVERALTAGEGKLTLSSRARASLDGLRESMSYIDGEVLPVVSAGDELRMWTFAGGRGNAMLASALRAAGARMRTIDNFGITLRGMDPKTLAAALDHVADADCQLPVDERMMEELKFGMPA